MLGMTGRWTDSLPIVGATDPELYTAHALINIGKALAVYVASGSPITLAEYIASAGANVRQLRKELPDPSQARRVPDLGGNVSDLLRSAAQNLLEAERGTLLPGEHLRICEAYLRSAWKSTQGVR